MYTWWAEDPQGHNFCNCFQQISMYGYTIILTIINNKCNNYKIKVYNRCGKCHGSTTQKEMNRARSDHCSIFLFFPETNTFLFFSETNIISILFKFRSGKPNCSSLEHREPYFILWVVINQIKTAQTVWTTNSLVINPYTWSAAEPSNLFFHL